MAIHIADEYKTIFGLIFLFIIGIFTMGAIFLLSSSVINDNIPHTFAIVTGIILTICGMLGVIMSCIFTFLKLEIV